MDNMTEGGKPVDLDDDNWCIDASDDEAVWEPSAPVILDMYTKISNGEIPELQWKNPGRDQPESDEVDEDKDDDRNAIAEDDAPEIAVTPTEFDFDDIHSEPSVTPRRNTSMTKTPRSQKRVARMDKILDDIIRRQKTDSRPRSPRSPRAVDFTTTPQRNRLIGQPGTPNYIPRTPGATPAPSPSVSVSSFPSPSVPWLTQPVPVPSPQPTSNATSKPDNS